MDYLKNNRMFSLLGQRGTFGVVLNDLASTNEKIFALSADLTRTSGLEKFSKNYENRFINVGIAEQNAVGVAAGIADQGLIPFVTTFANFATLRANEFVRHFMAYMKCNVKLVGLGSGFAMELFGTTHYGVEDIAVLRSFPNITILSPCDGLEVAKCVEASVIIDGPVYIRLSGRMNNPIVNKGDYEFNVGKAVKLKDGNDGVIFATGSMVYYALKAATQLETENIRIAVYNMHTIKPLDKQAIIDNANKKLILTVEEHSEIGGLGSAVSEVLAELGSHGKMVKIGTKNEYFKAGRYEYMLEKHGLTTENIIQQIKNNI